MGTIATLPRSPAGDSAAVALRSVVDSGVAPVFVVAAFILLLGFLYVVDAFTESRANIRATLVALLLPLLLTYGMILLFESILLLQR